MPTTDELRGLYRPPSPPTDLPFRVRTVGRVWDEPYHSTLGTYNDDAMLMLFAAGSGSYIRGAKSTPVTGPKAGLVLPGEDVGVLVADSKDPYDHWFCRFAGDYALELARRVVEQRGADPLFDWPDWTDGVDLLERMTRAKLTGPDLGDAFSPLDGMLAELLARLAVPDAAAPAGLTRAALQEYMHTHLSEPADLAAMAEHFELSKSHLCRKARPLLGQTIHRCWQGIKMDRARSLLRQSTLPVSEIARRVGFLDPLYFAKVFKTHIGCTPSEYRARGDR